MRISECAAFCVDLIGICTGPRPDGHNTVRTAVLYHSLLLSYNLQVAAHVMFMHTSGLCGRTRYAGSTLLAWHAQGLRVTNCDLDRLLVPAREPWIGKPGSPGDHRAPRRSVVKARGSIASPERPEAHKAPGALFCPQLRASGIRSSSRAACGDATSRPAARASPAS